MTDKHTLSLEEQIDALEVGAAYGAATLAEAMDRITELEAEKAELVDALAKAEARLCMAANYMATSFNISGIQRAERTMKLQDCATEARATLTKARQSEGEGNDR